MGFVQGSLLVALAAVIFPILAHLLFRRRFRPVDLGTLRFLKVAVRRDTRRRWLKRYLLLALRLGCVVALVLLFARPFRAEPSASGDAGLAVLLIDRSASMSRMRDGVRLIDQAVRQLPHVLTRVPDQSRVEAAWFDMRVEPIGSAEDARKALASLEAPATLMGGTDYATALSWAGGRCAAIRAGGSRAVHVFTDLQRTGFGSLEGFAFPKDVPVHVWDVGPASTDNIAITEVRPVSLMVRADHPTVIQASLLNARMEALDQRPVRLRLANKGKSLEIPAVASAAVGGSTTVTFETPPLGPGLWQGTVSVDADDQLPLDNARHVALYAAAQPRVLILDGAFRDVAVLDEAYYLERALRLAPPGETVPDGPFRVSVFPYGADAQVPDLEQVDVLVVANVRGFATPDAARIRTFLDRGGSAIVFGGNNLGPASAASYAAAGLSVGEVTGTHTAHDVPFRVAEFAGEHAMLTPFADPQHGDLRRLTFSGCTRVLPTDGAQVLARFREGTPLLLERQNGLSRVVWCAASVGREHGEWNRSRLFLPVVHQLVREAAGQTGTGPVRELPAAGEPPGVRQQGAVWEVRNLESQESELERCTPEEFAKRLGVKLAPAASESESATAQEDDRELRTGELWPWLWLALGVFWLTEGVLANRTVA
jgi:hypothetical protein